MEITITYKYSVSDDKVVRHYEAAEAAWKRAMARCICIMNAAKEAAGKWATQIDAIYVSQYDNEKCLSAWKHSLTVRIPRPKDAAGMSFYVALSESSRKRYEDEDFDTDVVSLSEENQERRYEYLIRQAKAMANAARLMELAGEALPLVLAGIIKEWKPGDVLPEIVSDIDV